MKLQRVADIPEEFRRFNTVKGASFVDAGLSFRPTENHVHRIAPRARVNEQFPASSPRRILPWQGRESRVLSALLDGK